MKTNKQKKDIEAYLNIVEIKTKIKMRQTSKTEKKPNRTTTKKFHCLLVGAFLGFKEQKAFFLL